MQTLWTLRVQLALSFAFSSSTRVTMWLNSVPSPARASAGPTWTAWEGEGAHQSPLLMAAHRGHVMATQVLLRHAFCIVREGGRLSCPRSNEAAAKRALARLLAAAENEGHHAVVEVLRKSGARPMANHELAEVTREEASSDGRVGARATPMESRSPFAQLLQNSAECAPHPLRPRHPCSPHPCAVHLALVALPPLQIGTSA